ncbi:efflux RND transporter permease subunit [Paraglaciecola sp.]|uniref:efflux RND transporter permease subunit n=1 Tax=Paraglaciecola sp. TaxID=1920173 RepID=UPI003EF4A8BD
MQHMKKSVMDMFVTKPVLAIVLSMVIVLVGLLAAAKLPILQYPQIESSSIEIRTFYVGASAKEIQGFVTEPIERAASSVPGIDYIESNSVAGSSTVTLFLELNENSTLALAELSTRLGQIKFELPQGAEDPAVSVKRADRPHASFYLDVNSKNMSREQLTDYLTNQVNPILSTIKGVQKVGLEGGRSPAMRIWIDPIKLAAFNLSSLDVRNALINNNVAATIGQSKNDKQRIDLIANTLMKTEQDFARLVIKNIDGSSITIGDIANVELAESEGELNAKFNNRQSIYISVWPLPGANEMAIGDELYKQIAKINPTLKGETKITVAYDATLYMRDAITEIFTTLAETVILVGIVILMLMGSFRSAIVPLITIPISILGALATMSLMGFSLNLLTILAIVLSVGLVVDDAIVVVENVAKYMREGMGRVPAALKSSRQLLTPIIGMTITLAAVYAPIGFMSGLTGMLFKEFVFTLAIAVLFSGVVALTLSPIMSAYLSPEGGKESKTTQWVNHQFTKLENIYAGQLKFALAWRSQLIAAAIFISLLTIPFYMSSKKELAPTEDQSTIIIIAQSPPESSLAYTDKNMNQIVDNLLSIEGGKEMWQIVMPTGGFGGVDFVPSDQRDFSMSDKIGEVYGSVSSIPGIKALPVLPPALPTAGNFDVELIITSTDSPEKMIEYANQIVGAAFGSGHFMFADSDLKIDLPQARLVLDRERVADLGLNLSEVNRQMSMLLSGNYVNRFNLEGRAYKVIPMVKGQDRSTPEALLDLQLTTPSGELIPLSAIAKLEKITAPRSLTRFTQQNSFKIYGGILPSSTKEQALTALEDIARNIMPDYYNIDYAGESRQIRKGGNSLMGILGVALIFVYFVLAIQFNSLRDPLVVLLGSVPLALAGAMLFPFLGLTTVNIYSQIGLITLVGLVAKNGILIVEFAKELQLDGYNKLDAITGAATSRLRPILMTTAATVLGHFPLMIVTGAGAEARNSIGLILVAGMLLGTFFTLYVLPNVYVLFAQTHKPIKDFDQLETSQDTPLIPSTNN